MVVSRAPAIFLFFLLGFRAPVAPVVINLSIVFRISLCGKVVCCRLTLLHPRYTVSERIRVGSAEGSRNAGETGCEPSGTGYATIKGDGLRRSRTGRRIG